MGFTLKQARQYAGFTQLEMARILGVSRDVYRKLERYPEKTPIELAKKFSTAVGIDIDQIFSSIALLKVDFQERRTL